MDLKRSGRLLLCVALLAIAARAQFIGYTGIQSETQKLLNAVSAPATGTASNIGQGSHWLTYCISGGTATAVQIQLEGSNTGTFTGEQVVLSNVGFSLSGCNVIEGGGFFPVVRANLVTYTPNGTTLTAWYNALAAPLSLAGINIFPPRATATPCNFSSFSQLASNTLTQLIAASPGKTIYVCSLTISFSAAPAAQLNGLTIGYYTGVCGGLAQGVFNISTGASSPLAQFFGGYAYFLSPGLITGIGVGDGLCASVGVLGAITTTVNYSYAQF